MVHTHECQKNLNHADPFAGPSLAAVMFSDTAGLKNIPLRQLMGGCVLDFQAKQ